VEKIFLIDKKENIFQHHTNNPQKSWS